jgi:outer membrane protein assembly factor BamB
MDETLEDHLRRTITRSSPRPDDDRLLALARDLLAGLAAAHAESPPRHPSLDPADIAMDGGTPRLGPGAPGGDAPEDLFQAGALLTAVALGRPADVAWRLDPAPRTELSTIRRRAALAGLVAPRRTDRYHTAAEALAAIEAAIAPSADGPAAWPMFRGGPDRAGARPGPAPASLAPRWHARVGAVVASPIVASDLVVAATADGRVAFVDRASGRVLETVVVGGTIESSPAVSGRVVHVGTDDGALVGVGLDDGRERYRVKLGGMVRSSPLAGGGLVVAGTVDAKGQGAVVARDEGGAPRWSRRAAAVFSSPAAADAAIVIGADDGAVHALDRETGAPRWSQRIGSKVRATPAVSGDVVFAASLDGNLAALAAADGARRWERAVGHSVYSSPCVAGGMVVFGCHDGHVHALDAARGEPRYETVTRGAVLSSPVALGGRVLAASTDGHAYLLDEQGAVVQRLPLPGGGTQSSFAVDGDLAVIGGAEGLVALTAGR